MAACATVNRRWLIPLLVATLTVSVIWFIQRSPSSDTLLPSGVLQVGVDASFPPFARFHNGVYSGIDIALAEEIARELGVEAVFINLGQDGLYDALITGQVDVLISALVERSDLRDRVRFSDPYYNAGLLLVMPGLSASSPSMWNMSGQRIAFAFGSDAHFEVERWKRRISAFVALPYELPDHALDAVRLGLADAALTDDAHLRDYLCRHPNWRVTRSEVTILPYVIAVSRDNARLYEHINNTLHTLFSSGRLDALIDEQFSGRCWTSSLERGYTALS